MDDESRTAWSRAAHESWIPKIKDPQPDDGVMRSILLPFVGAPLLFILLIHVVTRVGWFLGWR